jgi:hypothetical protein
MAGLAALFFVFAFQGESSERAMVKSFPIQACQGEVLSVVLKVTTCAIGLGRRSEVSVGMIARACLNTPLDFDVAF